MPKIIENLRQNLTREARRQILEEGYSAMTIRSVAGGCGVGTGTVYNYFPSKDALTAAVLLDDWMALLEALRAPADRGCEDTCRAVYEGLLRFRQMYTPLFHDQGAVARFPQGVGQYHSLLRSQLAEPLRPFCPDDFTAEFIAEALLTWTMEGKPFSELWSVIRKLTQ